MSNWVMERAGPRAAVCGCMCMRCVCVHKREGERERQRAEGLNGVIFVD